MKKFSAFLMVIIMICSLAACGTDLQESEADNTGTTKSTDVVEGTEAEGNSDDTIISPPENFVLIKGGTFEMGSPDTEAWRSDDEIQHTVTVSDFYMSMYEVTQAEYTELTGRGVHFKAFLPQCFSYEYQ